MNILLLPYSYPNRYIPVSAPFCRDHALALKKVGNEVIVIAVIPTSLKAITKKMFFDFNLKIIDDSGVKTYIKCFPSIPKLKRLNNYIRTKLSLNIYKKIVKNNFKPDLVHVHGFLSGDTARIIKKKEGIKYVITEHSTAFAQNLLSNSQYKQASRVFKDASLRIAVSEPFAKILNEKFNLDFIYIPNVVSLDYLELDFEKKKKGGFLKICNIGFLDRKKNHIRLLKAFKELKEIYKDIELHIVGSGPELNNIKNFIKNNYLEKNVFLYGALDRNDVFRVLKKCDIFALSSNYETFGVVIIEALACGLPVVSTKSGGPESIIINNDLGVLTQNNDIDFSEGLKLLVERYSENEFNTEKIINYAKDNFTFEAVGFKLNYLYHNLLNGEHK